MKILLRLMLNVVLMAVVVRGYAAPQDNWALDFAFSGASSNGSFNLPRGVAFTTGNKIVVADSGNNRIQVFDQTGAFLFRFGSAGTQNGQFANPTVAAGLNGEIVVCDRGNYRIQIFAADGSFLHTFGSKGFGDGQFSGLTSAVVTADGKIVVADNGNIRIQVFDADGTFIRQWVSDGTQFGQFFPTGVTLDASGNVVVADSGASRILVFTINGEFLRKWSTGGASMMLTTLSDGKIAAADTVNNRVVIFSADGTMLRTWGGAGAAPGQFTQPNGIAVTADGRIVVSDTENHRVQIFDPNGALLSQFGKYSSGVDGFGPNCIAIEIDAQRRIYVGHGLSASGKYADIQAFEADGTPVWQYFLEGSTIPTSLKLGPDGRIYSGRAAGIIVFDRDGTVVRKIGSAGTGDGQFTGENVELAIDTNGDIYALDAGTKRVQVFDSQGTLLRQFSNPLFLYGNAITLTSDGRVRISALIINPYAFYYTKEGEAREQLTGSAATMASQGKSGSLGFDPTTGASYTFDTNARQVQVWRRGFRTLGPRPPKLVPSPEVRAVAQRANGYVDIDYSVADGDSTTVSTALAAFRGGSSLLRDLVPVPSTALVEGTATKIGPGVPSRTLHRVTWNPAGSGLSSGDVVFEVFARDDRAGLLDMDFVTLPTPQPLSISRIPFTHADMREAWAWLLLTGEPGLSRTSDGEIAGPGGTFTSTNGTETRTTATGRSWLFAKLGVREATTAEVATARLATAATTPNRFTPALSQRMGDRPKAVNEWSFDSSDQYGTEAWWVVPLK